MSGWQPIPVASDESTIDIRLADGSVLCGVMQVTDGKLGWHFDSSCVTHWRVHEDAPPAPSADCCTRATCRIGHRVPLTDDEIAELAARAEASDPADSFWREIVRAVERAHGIGGSDE